MRCWFVWAAGRPFEGFHGRARIFRTQRRARTSTSHRGDSGPPILQRPVPCGAGVLRHRLVSFERARGEDRELLMSVEGLCVRSLWEIASGDVVYPSTLAVAALGFSGLGGRNPFPLGLRGPGRLPVCLPSLCLGGTERARASPSGDRVPNRELGRIRYFPPSGAIPMQTAYTDARPGVQCARALLITGQGSGRVYVGLCSSRASCTLHTALGASFLGT